MNLSKKKLCKTLFLIQNKVKASRRAEGKYPYLPADLDQRAQIKAEYMKTKPPQEE